MPPSDIGDLPNDIFQLGRSSGTTGTVDPTVLYPHQRRRAIAARRSTTVPTGWPTRPARSTFRNTGSTTATAPDSLATPRNDATVPKSDFDRPPAALWTTERNDPAGGNEMQWNFPVAAGTPIQVRLYLANRSTSTDLRR